MLMLVNGSIVVLLYHVIIAKQEALPHFSNEEWILQKMAIMPACYFSMTAALPRTARNMKWQVF